MIVAAMGAAAAAAAVGVGGVVRARFEMASLVADTEVEVEVVEV
jgi:hypothetical protein